MEQHNKVKERIDGFDIVKLHSPAPTDQAAIEADGWISVDDRLPEVGEDVLWFHNGHYIVEQLVDKDDNEHLLGGYSSDCQTVFAPASHWQPLPNPPQP